MKITKISLRNFKCFKDVEIDFKKITILTGSNSSGKSSLLYGVLSPLQSQGFPMTFSPNGKYVNMGDFIEISYNNLKSNKISLNLILENEDEQIELFSIWMMNGKTQQPKLNYLESNTRKHKLKIYLKSNEYYLDLEFKNKEEYFDSKEFEVSKALAGFIENMEKIRFENDKEKKTSKNRKLSETIFSGYLNVDDVHGLKIGRLDNLSNVLSKNDLFNAMQIVAETTRYFEVVEKNLGFVNSFRLFPDRTYYQVTKSDYKIGGFGENYIDQLLRWHENKSKSYKDLISELRDLELLNSVEIKKLDGGRFELKVQAKSGGAWASVVDVGFGISQFLPVLVADKQLSKNSTLVLAQPEIHLHPNVQAKLADYFVRQVNNKGKRYIIETHSEYLLNRLRLMIVKGEISAEDVAVYYLENTSKGTNKYTINFTKDGQIKNAPKGFFETYMMDVMDIALHAE